ncbi:MAG: hypothetical protein ABW277_03350 [Longimicrobiaceae bacterium]
MLDLFVSFSQVMTGDSDLDRKLAMVYLARIEGEPAGVGLPALLHLFQDIVAGGGDVETQVRQRILEDPEHWPLARQILLLWYTSALRSTGGGGKAVWIPGTEEEYFGALIWPAIRAHPPGLSGGYFGHWTYPPEN